MLNNSALFRLELSTYLKNCFAYMDTDGKIWVYQYYQMKWEHKFTYDPQNDTFTCTSRVGQAYLTPKLLIKLREVLEKCRV